jgi:Flp pilus assembly protein CpaB
MRTSSGPGRARRRLRVVRRHLLLRRRYLAALLAGVAVLAGLRATAPPPPPTVPVTVAARDLPAGTVLAAADLATRDLPTGTFPAGLAVDPAGRVLAAPVSRGEPLTSVRLVGPALAAADPGRVVLPVRLSDAGVAALLRPGDEVDLLATDPGTGATELLAAGVRVMAVPPASDPATGTQAGALVVVGVAPSDATEVTSAWVSRFLTVAWSR